MDLGLNGKRALVTGSTAGIGRGIARQLAIEGAQVAINGRDPARTSAAAQALSVEAGAVVAGIAADLATDEGAQALASGAARVFGGVDILVNNYGVYHDRGWWDTNGADWQDVYNRNVVSAVRLIRLLAPAMREQRWGRIVNISSGGGWQPFATMADYSATKAALLNLTVSLARELAGTGVTVNTVSPGIIVTEATRSYFQKVAQLQNWPSDWASIEQRIMTHFLSNSTGRLGRPTDVGSLVALVASPLSDYMNGANYRVDGGSTIAIN